MTKQEDLNIYKMGKRMENDKQINLQTKLLKITKNCKKKNDPEPLKN